MSLVTALVLVITPICSGLTRTWQELLIVRLILGIGMHFFHCRSLPFELTRLVQAWEQKVGPRSYCKSCGNLGVLKR